MEDKWRWMLVTAIAPIAWGSNYFVTAHFLPEGSPLWGAALRALPAGLLLVLIARRLPRGSWWWRSVVLGALNVGAFFILIFVASQLLPSSVAATIMATSAGVLLLLAWPLLGERPRPLGVLGAALGFGGVCVLLVGDDVTIAPWGVAASVLAMLMSSTGFVLTKRWASSESPLTVTSWQLIAGGLLVLPVAALVEGAPPAMDAAAVAGFSYVIVVATAIAFVAWFTGLRHLPAGTVGVIGLLNPVTGVLLGTLLAAEPFGPRQLIGTVLVLAGVAVAAYRYRMRCPCLSGLPYDECCGRFHEGAAAPTAEALMRSRYSAYATGNIDYILSTWHPSTRPADRSLDDSIRWYRLDILSTSKGGPLDSTGTVEFEAFYRGGSQRELSSFVREAGRWYYLAAV